MFSPLIFFGENTPAAQTRTYIFFILSISVFAPYAWLSLKEFTKIYRAEKLVEHQAKHAQKIPIES